MVGFREFVERKARLAKIGGFVENANDGTVLVVAEGDEEALKGLLSDLWRGSAGSRVENVSENWTDSKNEFRYFEIRF